MPENCVYYVSLKSRHITSQTLFQSPTVLSGLERFHCRWFLLYSYMSCVCVCMCVVYMCVCCVGDGTYCLVRWGGHRLALLIGSQRVHYMGLYQVHVQHVYAIYMYMYVHCTCILCTCSRNLHYKECGTYNVHVHVQVYTCISVYTYMYM